MTIFATFPWRFRPGPRVGAGIFWAPPTGDQPAKIQFAITDMSKQSESENVLGNRAQGPTKNEQTGLTGERKPAAGPLLIENHGGEKPALGDWAVLDSQGVKLNGPITTAAAAGLVFAAVSHESQKTGRCGPAERDMWV